MEAEEGAEEKVSVKSGGSAKGSEGHVSEEGSRKSETSVHGSAHEVENVPGSKEGSLMDRSPVHPSSIISGDHSLRDSAGGFSTLPSPLRTPHMSEEVVAIDEEVLKTVMKDSIDSVLDSSTEFDESCSADWAKQIRESVIKRLASFRQPYKLLVKCTVTENVGAGYQAAVAAFWDGESEEFSSLVWENDTVLVVLNVFAVSLYHLERANFD